VSVSAIAEAAGPADGFETARQSVVQAVADGDLAGARRLIEALPAAWRRRPALRVLEIRLLFGEGRLDLAEAEARALLDERPGLAAVGPLLVRAVLRQGRVGEARELFEAQVWPGPAAVEIKSALISELIRAGNDDESRLFLDRIDAADTLPAHAVGRIAAADWRAGMPERAIERLLAAERREGLSRTNQDLLVRILFVLGRLEEARPRVAALAASETDGAERMHRLIQLRLLEGDTAGAGELMAEAVEGAPNNWFILKQLGRMPIPPERLESLVATIAASRESLPFSRPALWHLAIVALHARRTADALAVLDELALGQDDHAQAAAMTARLLRMLPIEAWTERARLRDDLRQAVQTVRVEAAVATLVVFPGLDNRLCWLPQDYLDVLFAAHPVNVVYLRDHGFYGFVQGLPGVGADPRGMAEGLRELAVKLGQPRIVTLGVSVGGFQAMRIGAMMRADAAVSFSGPTLLAPAGEGEAGLQNKIGMAILRNHPQEARDVLPELAAWPSMRIRQFPGADNAEDMRQADRIAHLPQVRTEPLSGVDAHGTLSHAVVAGDFDRILAEALAADG
jgi:hypothetical protein